MHFEEYQGVPPLNNIYTKYWTNEVAQFGGFKLLHAREQEQSVGASLAEKALSEPVKCGADKRWLPELNQRIWAAHGGLRSAGFVYEALMVFSGNPAVTGVPPLYLLRSRNQHGYVPKGEEGLLNHIQEVAKRVNRSVAIEGRFDGTYPVLVPDWVRDPHVVGVYRLRFRVTNPHNRGVADGWYAHERRQQQAAGWVESAMHAVPK